MVAQVQYGSYMQGEIVHFTQMVCGSCGIPFAVPTNWYVQKKNEKAEFRCPNGCCRVFIGKSEVEKLKEEIEKVKAASQLENQKLWEKHMSVLSEKNSLERKLIRVGKGVCPCCNRSFANLKNHMKQKHPEITKSK